MTAPLALSLALVLAVAACGAPAPSIAHTSTATASSTIVAAESPARATGPAAAPGISSPPSGGAAWRLVELPDSADVGMIADVLATSGRVIADAAAGQAAERGIAWTSTDAGATWTSEPTSGTGQGVARMTAWGDRVLAIGVGDGGGECAHPASVDIRVRDAAGTWAAAPFDQLFCAGGLPQAAASGQHAAIVGSGTGDQAYAWSSEDGLHWTDRSEVFTNRFPAGVVADGSGFVAFGSGLAPGPAWTARSDDGATWRAPESLPRLAEASMLANPVTFDGTPAAFVADPSGAVGIVRPDGQGGWRTEPCNGISSATLTRVVPIENWLVALGGDDNGPLAWISPMG